VVEQGTCVGNLSENPVSSASVLRADRTEKLYALFEILNPLTVLLERHRSRVIHQDDNIEKTDLDQVCGELDGQLPS